MRVEGQNRSFFGFDTQCKKGHSETDKLGHSMGRKKSLFKESNFQADSQDNRTTGGGKSLDNVMGSR